MKDPALKILLKILPEDQVEIIRLGESISVDACLREVSGIAILGDCSRVPLRSLEKIFQHAAQRLSIGGRLAFRAPDPEAQLQTAKTRPWPGEALPGGGHYRPLRHYLELARLKGMRLTPPRSLPASTDLIYIAIKEDPSPASWRQAEASTLAERSDQKYGAGSSYRRFDRLEDPESLEDLCYARERMKLAPRSRVLSLGCNDGRELELFDQQSELRFLGIDAAPSAIAAARLRFPGHRFEVSDLALLSRFDLPLCDAALLLNVLQCTTVDRDRLLSDLVPLLAPRASVLISIPDCQALGFDVVKRPLSRRDPRRDRSLVHKDMRYLTRFFYRAGFRKVECFGALDAFLLALR